MTTRDPVQKEMATEKKEERIDEAERQKREAQHRNAAAGHNTAEQMGGVGRHGTNTGYGTGGTY